MLTTALNKELLLGLTEIVSEPEFQAMDRTQYYQNFIGDYVKFSETQIVQMLSWYLNPKEGHFEGDFFIKSLLAAYINTCDKNDLTEGHIKALGASYNDVSVLTEFTLPNKKRIDLMLLDSTNKVLFIIERKDGTLAHSGQLSAYKSWADEHFQNWCVFYILSDSESRDHGSEHDSAYIKLDDTWLENSILNLKELGRVTEPNLHTFNMTLRMLAQEHEYEYEKTWATLCRVLSSKHARFISKLESTKFEVGNEQYGLLDISPKVYLSLLVKDSKLATNNLFNLLQKYHDHLNQLNSFSEFEVFEQSLHKITPSHIDLEVEYGKDRISFLHSTDKINEESFWPYYLTLERVESEGKEHFQLSINVDKNAHEDAVTYADQIALAYDLKLKSNQKFKKKILIEQLDSLSLHNERVLRSKVHEFFDVIKQLDRG